MKNQKPMTIPLKFTPERVAIAIRLRYIEEARPVELEFYSPCVLKQAKIW
ncbi:MAG: hypothetical protein ACE5FZ_08415 [Nitrospiria bacterium]